MVVYVCIECNFTTLIKSHYMRHIQTNKHLELSHNKSKYTVQINTCKYCNKEFKYMQSMYRHIKYTCKQNKDEDVKELVRLMNLKLEQKDKELELHKKQLETQGKQIEKLMCKLQINNIVHCNVINNIQLLPYNKTDYSHLTEKDFVSAIKKVNFCVKNIIEKIHFNPEKPENMNIYISNLKDKYMMMYEDGNWNIKNKTEIERVYDDKEMLLDDWLDREQHKYPDLKDKFMRYINNKEDDDTLNMIKDDIKIMLYNKKSLIEC